MTIYGDGENDKMDLRVAQPDSTGKQQLDENANQGSECACVCVYVCVGVCVRVQVSVCGKKCQSFEMCFEKKNRLEEKSPFLVQIRETSYCTVSPVLIELFSFADKVLHLPIKYVDI